MSEALLYWKTLGVEQKVVFELDSGELGLCRDFEEIDLAGKKYYRFTCVSMLRRDGSWQAYSIYQAPKAKVSKIEEYRAEKSESLFSALSRILRGRSNE